MTTSRTQDLERKLKFIRLVCRRVGAEQVMINMKQLDNEGGNKKSALRIAKLKARISSRDDEIEDLRNQNHELVEQIAELHRQIAVSVCTLDFIETYSRHTYDIYL